LRVDAATHAPRPPTGCAMAVPKLILLVEDDPHIAELMRLHLADEG
jgi:hypothetical protein